MVRRRLRRWSPVNQPVDSHEKEKTVVAHTLLLRLRFTPYLFRATYPGVAKTADGGCSAGAAAFLMNRPSVFFAELEKKTAKRW